MTHRRTISQFVLLVAPLLVLAPYCFGADVIELGETYKMDLSEEMKHIPGVILGDAHQSEAIISLTAGRSYKLTAKAVGKGRQVGVLLLDRKDVRVTGYGVPNGPNPTVLLKPQSIVVTAEEVHVTGEYRVVVISPLIGSCTLTVEDITKEDITKDDESIESLQKEKMQLLRKLKVVEEKLEKRSSLKPRR